MAWEGYSHRRKTRARTLATDHTKAHRDIAQGNPNQCKASHPKPPLLAIILLDLPNRTLDFLRGLENLLRHRRLGH